MGLKIKARLEEKALGVNQTLTINAQIQYVKRMANEEGLDYAVMWEICNGMREYPDAAKFTLGLKLSDPAWMIALFKQPRKKKRQQAAENFADSLSADEAEIFWSEVFNTETGKMFKDELKRKKKEKGVVEDGTDEEEE